MRGGEGYWPGWRSADKAKTRGLHYKTTRLSGNTNVVKNGVIMKRILLVSVILAALLLIGCASSTDKVPPQLVLSIESVSKIIQKYLKIWVYLR